jgi:hypothetical protein
MTHLEINSRKNQEFHTKNFVKKNKKRNEEISEVAIEGSVQKLCLEINEKFVIF